MASIRQTLTDEQVLIVAAKLAGPPDTAIASRLDISRRAAAYRKSIVFAMLADTLDPLTDEARLECLDRLAPTLQDVLLQSRSRNASATLKRTRRTTTNTSCTFTKSS